MAGGNDAETRERILEVLDWAASIFRPGTSAHGELAGFAARVRDPAVHLSPLLGPAVGTARRLAGDLARAAAALRKATDGLPRDEALDPEAVLALEAGAEALRARLRGVVTYEDVIQVLQGSWGDNDLGEAISALGRDLARRAGEARAALAEEAAAPAP